METPIREMYHGDWLPSDATNIEDTGVQEDGGTSKVYAWPQGGGRGMCPNMHSKFLCGQGPYILSTHLLLVVATLLPGRAAMLDFVVPRTFC